MTHSQQSDDTTALSTEPADAQTPPNGTVPESVQAAEVAVAEDGATPEAAHGAAPDDATADAAAAPAAEAPAAEVPAAEAPAAEVPAQPEAPAQEAAVAPSPASTVPAPRTPSPAALAARPKLPAAAAPAPAPVAATAVNLEEAAKFGRAEDDGHVFLKLDGEEYPVGQYPGATKDEALAYFARKFEDITAQVTLLEQRVEAKAATTDMNKTVNHLRAQLAEHTSVGDINGALARLTALEEAIKALQARERATHEAARGVELAAREAIVAEAETLAAEDPATVMWKVSSARMNELFESWKQAQKTGMRLGRATEEGLWKRFRSARTVFDRHRRAYFSQLDNNNAAAKSAKEALITAAEELSSSTEWGFAAGEYRRLMDQWKATPRASRKDDDALWGRFRAAQDKFFKARQSANEAIDEEFGANLVVKEALITEAQALLPVTDLAAAKKSLQSIRDRWEEAGKVPRADMQRVEGALRKVEDAVKAADDDNWRRSDPEAKARTSSALTQLEATIAGLKEDLAAAEKSGDARKAAQAREALAARELWLEQIRKAAEDFS
ncbi:ATPase [Bacillus sp. SRB_336]|nr:ATPase [Bacillus sp. SRB_336]